MIRLAALAAAVLLSLTACDDKDDTAAYDEAAHREAVKASIGVAGQTDNAATDRAWKQYKAAAEQRCAKTGTDYEYVVAVFLDEGMLETLHLDTKYLCPEKQGELDDTLSQLGY